MILARDIIIELTLKCNLSCKMCARQFLRDKQSQIPLEMVERLASQLAGYASPAPLNFALGGYGEPLLYPHLGEVIRLLKQALPQSQVAMVSNAWLLNEAKGRMLLEAGLDYLRLSLNATTAREYQSLMNADGFGLVEKNIRRFLRMKRDAGSKLKTGIQVLDTKVNAANYPEYRQQWEPLLSGDDFITYRLMENHGGKVDSSQLSGGGSPGVIKDRWPCSALWRNLALDTQGNAYACCEAYTLREAPGPLLLGNLREASLPEILESAALRQLQEKHLRNDYEGLEVCRSCTKPINYPNYWRLENGVWVEEAESGRAAGAQRAAG